MHHQSYTRASWDFSIGCNCEVIWISASMREEFTLRLHIGLSLSQRYNKQPFFTLGLHTFVRDAIFRSLSCVKLTNLCLLYHNLFPRDVFQLSRAVLMDKLQSRVRSCGVLKLIIDFWLQSYALLDHCCSHYAWRRAAAGSHSGIFDWKPPGLTEMRFKAREKPCDWGFHRCIDGRAAVRAGSEWYWLNLCVWPG